MRVFVTATGTDVGKTVVMCRLIEEFLAAERVLRVLKPIATGFDSMPLADTDTGRLLQAQGLPLTSEQVAAASPWRFAAPLSPDMAADREGRTIPFAEVVEFCRRPAGLTLIEGIGGVMVPIDPAHTVLDWIEALAPATLLVAGSYLGTLSHTLTAVTALRTRGIEPSGIVLSESAIQPVPAAETAASLRRAVPGLPVVAFPRLPCEDELPRLAELLATVAG
jgi:dethiobiotin synthetase